MRSVVFILAVLLLPVAAPLSIPSLHEPHPPILIEGNAEFLAPGSGVRRGSGALEDPYVIEGWTIPSGVRSAIRIANTTAHVVVQDIVVTPSAGASAFFQENREEVETDRIDVAVGTPFTLHFERVENLTIRRVSIVGEVESPEEIRFVATKNVLIEDVDLGPEPPGELNAFRAMSFRFAEDTVVRRVHVTGFLEAIHTWNVSRFVLEDSTFDGRADSSDEMHISVSGSNITLRRNHIVAGMITHAWASGSTHLYDFRMEDNVMEDGHGIWIRPTQWTQRTLDRFVFCRNVVRLDEPFSPFRVEGYATDVKIIGNVFEGGAEQFSLFGGGSVIGNTFRNITDPFKNGVSFNPYYSPHKLIRNNSFESISPRVIAGFGNRSLDMRENWWGDPSGPSGDGPGSGVVFEGGNTPLFEPWLTSPPPLATNC